MTSDPTTGIATIASAHDVDATVARFKQLLDAARIKLFALIDHSGEAEAAGLKMRKTRLLIFGNPKAGTPLMIAAPTIALDLPLKALLWEDADGRAWISYRKPDQLLAQHHAPQQFLANIAGMEQLVAKAAQ